MSTPRKLNVPRCRRLMERAVRRVSLDLSGLTVLTEAATGAYALTPLLAAAGGSPRVLAMAKDSLYGTERQATDCVAQLAEDMCLPPVVEFVRDRNDPRLGQADVVTNLGFVRPIDTPFLERLKPTAVIPLMWETWEFRQDDLDLDACRRLGIPVLGTNESSPLVETFAYVGCLAIRLLWMAQIEVVSSRICVVGSGVFGDRAELALQHLGASVDRIETTASSVRKRAILEGVACADALVVSEHHDRRPLIGEGSGIPVEELRERNPGLVVAHICGNVGKQALLDGGIAFVPERIAPPGHMSITTDDLGPRPLIDLHAAGLKVGEMLARARSGGASAEDAERTVLASCPLAQGFPEPGEERIR